MQLVLNNFDSIVYFSTEIERSPILLDHTLVWIFRHYRGSIINDTIYLVSKTSKKYPLYNINTKQFLYSSKLIKDEKFNLLFLIWPNGFIKYRSVEY
jgi:hypothetical protein